MRLTEPAHRGRRASGLRSAPALRRTSSPGQFPSLAATARRGVTSPRGPRPPHRHQPNFLPMRPLLGLRESGPVRGSGDEVSTPVAPVSESVIVSSPGDRRRPWHGGQGLARWRPAPCHARSGLDRHVRGDVHRASRGTDSGRTGIASLLPLVHQRRHICLIARCYLTVKITQLSSRQRRGCGKKYALLSVSVGSGSRALTTPPDAGGVDLLDRGTPGARS